MAKSTGAALITDLATRMDLDSTNATVRVDMLRQLNISLKEICQDHSLRFLVTQGTLSVASSSVAVPSTIDDSKALTLGRPDGTGEIEYVPTDEWYRTRIDTYGEPATPTEPTHYTVALVAGVNTFLFKPAGLTATVPYLAQAIVTALADNATGSVLPEGFEDTLLLDHAEGELRRAMNEPFWQELAARANEKKERLYSSYRTTKEQPMTDREQEERKVSREKLGAEK